MLLRYFMTEMLLPPALNGWLLLLAVLLWRVRRSWATAVGALALGSLMLLSMPLVKQALYQGLETYPPIDLPAALAQQPAPEAIVVLSGGLIQTAPEYGHSVAGSSSLKRALYGAELHRQSGLPLLLSGGVPGTAELSEAEAMAQVLANQSITPQWLEKASLNTWENARFSAQILQQQGIHKVVLVTEAWHLPRAVYAFQQQGIDVVPAGTGYRSLPVDTLYGLIPNAMSLQQSAFALREYLGMLAYRWGHAEP